MFTKHGRNSDSGSDSENEKPGPAKKRKPGTQNYRPEFEGGDTLVMSSTIKQETAKQDESMKMTETWCGICLIPLTGPHSAKQHYSGGKHKKKACITPSQTSCMNTTVPVTGLCSFDAGLNRGLCQICQIAFTSLDHAQSHFMGSKHKKAVKVYSIQKERSALQEVNAPDNVIRTPSSIAKSTEKLTTSPTETDVVSLNMPCRKEEYPVKMMDAWCGICLIPLSGPLQAQQHYNGDKHFKKASSTTQTSYMDLAVPVTGLCSFDEGLNCGSCQICKVAFTSLEHAQAHLSGSKHNKAERLYSALKESSALQDVNAPDNGIPTPSSIVTSMQQTMSAAGIDGGTCNQVMSSSEEDSAGSPMKMTDAWCGVCCIPISSPQTAKQHYSGYKHWKKANCTPSPIRTTDQAVHDIGFHAFDPGQNKNFCQICKIAFTSLEHAQSHLSGSKHNKAERMYSALKGRSALQEVNAPDNGILTSSSMVPSMQQTMSATVIGGSSLVIPSMEEKADGSPGKMTDSLCGVCCVTFSGPSSAQQHYTSENHRKKAKYMALPIMSMDPAVHNNAIYEFDPVTNRGFCQICQIILTSAQHADSHLKGSKHIKAEQRHTTMIERSSLQPVNITSDDQLLPPERIVKSMEKQTVGELNKLATCSPILNTPHFSQDIMVTSSLATAGRDWKLYRPNNEGKPITQLPFSFPKINLQDYVTIINSDIESQRKCSCNMHVSGDNHSASLANVDDKFDKDTQLSAPLSALDNKEI